MVSYDMSDIQADLVTLGVYLVRCCVSAYIRLCPRRTTEEVVRSCHLTDRVLEDGDRVPSAIVLETWSNGSKKKSWVQYGGEVIVDHESPFSFPYKAPWFWIGYKTLAGDMIDLTAELSEFVVGGNLIKPELIHTLYPRSETGTLVYIDPKTFEIKDLSSEGLVIEDEVPPTSPELVPDSGRVRSPSATSRASGVDRVESATD